MPNRCNNTLSIFIPDELDFDKTIQDIAAKIYNEDWQPSFSTLVPQPADISDMPHTWPKEKDAELIAKYWVDNRYDWRIKNRWTKRDISPDASSWSVEDLRLTFDTARGPPEEWFAKLCETFPSIGFTLEYREEWQQFCGTLEADYEWGRRDFPDTFYQSCDDCWDANDTVERYEKLDWSYCKSCAISH